jgi:hypothetical protein
MIASIKEIMVEVKRIESIGWLISDIDANRIINRKTRTKRGKTISKEKVVDVTSPFKMNGTTYYPLMLELDDCYHNNIMLNK